MATDAERLAEARSLLDYALHLRMYGERAPGGNETWREFDRRCEAFLRATDGQIRDDAEGGQREARVDESPTPATPLRGRNRWR